MSIKQRDLIAISAMNAMISNPSYFDTTAGSVIKDISKDAYWIADEMISASGDLSRLHDAVKEFCESFNSDETSQEVASQAHFYKKIFKTFLNIK
jgi:hypothetical protein